MTESVVYKNERVTEHCAQMTPSNLMLMLGRETPDRTILAHKPVYTTPSTHQRCFSQFDRKTDCFDSGVALPVGSRQAESDCYSPSSAANKAVCGTQTRLDGFQVKNQPDCQKWLEDCIGPTAVCKCSPRTGTYVDWGPEYTHWYIPNVERAGAMSKENTLSEITTREALSEDT